MPDDCIVVGVPGRVIFREGVRVNDPVPDIEAEAIKCLSDKVAMLEKQVKHMQALPVFEPLFTGPRRAVSTSKVVQLNPPNVVPNSDAIDKFLHGAGI